MSTEHEQPTQEQIDAALAIVRLLPIKREMTSPEIDAWFSARDAVSAHARLGETNVETAARILAEAYKSATKPSETHGQKTLTFRTFQTPDGKPTCIKNLATGELCRFVETRRLGTVTVCTALARLIDLDEYDDCAGYLKPCDRCPLHNRKDDNAI